MSTLELIDLKLGKVLGPGDDETERGEGEVSTLSFRRRRRRPTRLCETILGAPSLFPSLFLLPRLSFISYSVRDFNLTDISSPQNKKNEKTPETGREKEKERLVILRAKRQILPR